MKRSARFAIVALGFVVAGSLAIGVLRMCQSRRMGIIEFLHRPVREPIPDAIGMSCQDSLNRFGTPHFVMSFQTQSEHEGGGTYVNFHEVAEWTGCDEYRDGYAVVAYYRNMQLGIQRAFDTRELGLRTTYGQLDRARFVVIELREGVVVEAQELFTRFI